MIKKIELGNLTDESNKSSNVNIVTFDHVGIFRISEILNELKFIDVSTPSGVADAAAAGGTYTHIFDCRMYIEDQIKDVSIFGRKNANA